MENNLALIIILTEGIRGHLFQSRGIAKWLSKETGAIIREYTVPLLKDWDRFYYLKLGGRALPGALPAQLEKWITGSGGKSLIDNVRLEIECLRVKPGNCLIISAGSNPARYNLAIGNLMGIRTCVLMTPSLLGTNPFTFAVVPEHDFPGDDPNVLGTLGAPNAIMQAELDDYAEDLLKRYPSSSTKEKWAILLGGDDANYSLEPQWVREKIPAIIHLAEMSSADLYITTSRRTTAEAEKVLLELTEGLNCVRMLLLASRDEFNPVPGMLGLCTNVFCTEDSVSMLSESVTAGHMAYLLRVGRKRGWRCILQRLTSFLVDVGFLKSSVLWGIPRFDSMIEDFKKRGLVQELPSCTSDWNGFYLDSGRSKKDFNEARRAAEWILKRWNN